MECIHDKAPWPRSRFAARQGRTDVGGEFVDTHLRRARRHSRGYLSHDGAIADSIGLDRRERQEPHRHLHHPRARRSFLWPGIASGAFPARKGGRDTRGRQGHAGASVTRQDRELLATAFPGRDSRSLVGCRTAGRRRARAGGAQACRGERGADRYGPPHLLVLPSIGLIVGGDAVYNGIHPYLGETDIQSRLEWISTLDKLEARKSKAVVAGHKVPENDDDPRIIGETRQYLRDFDRLNEATASARELYDVMLELYPDRVNPGSLWGAANTAKNQA